MYSKWIKSGFILAMLLVSMVSLSMAACPWFIKNELYTAQCGDSKKWFRQVRDSWRTTPVRLLY